MKKRFIPLMFSIILLGFATATSVSASTIHVPREEATIQAGIDAAANGDTVLVDPGTYFENINFNGKAITVSSAGGAAVTIVDGGNIAPVVTFSSGETTDSMLSRFTLQHGASSYESRYMAGGIYISYSSPTVSDNIITDNTALGGGGGIAVEFGSPRIIGNKIQNNTQGAGSGGIGGGGISVGGIGTTQILNNVISNNSWTSGNGGGISLFASGAVTIRGNVIKGNSVSGVIPAAVGGGIYIASESPARIVQNLIYGNTADLGGGIYFSMLGGQSGLTLVNNTIANNPVRQLAGSAVYADGFDNQVPFYNNLMIGQHGQSAVFCEGANSNLPPSVANSDGFSPGGMGFAGTCAGFESQNGNISADPKFVNRRKNFKLMPDSPAIDAGTNSAPLLPRKDFSRQERVVDGDDDGNAIIDMGPYEFQ